ncbi:MAG: tail fiber domain-containing protein, partial [Patescibacteria group bacterium]|nr:tail fiber domain-containing protein [Patescibacteria group bacterium]
GDWWVGSYSGSDLHIKEGIYSGTTRLTIQDGTGNIGIGITNPSVTLDVIGSIEYTGTITDVSDIRLKTNIIPLSNSLDKIIKLEGFTFEHKNKEKYGQVREAGISAQALQQVLPEAVSVINDNGYLGVDYTQIIPLLIEGIKELRLENKKIQTENVDMKDMIYKLQKEVESLKN